MQTSPRQMLDQMISELDNMEAGFLIIFGGEPEEPNAAESLVQLKRGRDALKEAYTAFEAMTASSEAAMKALKP